jgi:hypothetical protein
VSSGDAGVTSTIGTPATDPNVISVGATTTYRLDAQDGYGGARFPGVTGWLDNNISSFSSGGFEQDGQTIDLVAPGELNWALCSTVTAMYGDCNDLAGNPTPVIAFGGTSESAPLTAGVAALVIQAYRNAHDGASPSPTLVKQIITGTADDVGAPADQQGAGLLDAYKAVRASESYGKSSHGPTFGPSFGRSFGGGTLLASASQLNATDAPGTPETLTDTITNTGGSTQSVALSTRAIGPYTQLQTATVDLSDTASPHVVDWQGINDNYEPVTFFVPPSQNRLNAAIAFQNSSASLNARVRMTLIDPNGRLAGYSVPQGDGNYGDIQVTDPAPGRWTAYIYSRDSTDGGTTGSVLFAASSATYVQFGHVSPSFLTLAPGRSANVNLTVSTPSQPGDADGAIVLGSGLSATTIPVTLRSPIPTGPESFNATLTGGNGRGSNTGESFTYELDLPSGLPELNATVTLGDNNPNNTFQAWLISPSGEALAFAANQFPANNAAGYTPELGAQLHTLNPAGGEWVLEILFAPAVSGTAISEPFTVSTDESPVPASPGGLPDAASTKLTAGDPYNYNIQIRNTGTAPEAYFPDARLPTTTTLNLAAQNNADATVPLSVFGNIPVYLVPTDTTAFSEQATDTTGTEPIQFDSASPTGDPDIESSVGTTASATFDAQPLSQGPWDIAPDVVGPFGATGAASETVSTSMSVTTDAFDPAVTSAAGDLWLGSGDPSTLASFNPVVAGPGQVATIPVTITPSGPSSSTVSGTLYIDDTNLFLYGLPAGSTLNGNQIVAIPYSYTIK